MKKLLDINVRRVQNASNDVARRRKNAGFPDAPVPVTVPKFEIQVISTTDEKAFLANPKYPVGTIYIDPQGNRMKKVAK